MSDTSDKILLKREGRIGIITLNNPQEANALTAHMMRELYAAICQCDRDDNMRVVIIRANGKNFCAGANLNDPEKQNPDQLASDTLITTYFPAIDRIGQSDKIFIAAVNGACAGVAGGLMMGCDLAIMAENAYMYQAFMAIALIPDGGTHWHLLHMIGYKRALSFIINMEKISAAQCVEIGLANQLISDDGLDEATIKQAENIIAGAPLAQRATKKILRAAAHQDFATNYMMESHSQDALIKSKDHAEGVDAFFNKRKPNFTGQ